MAVNTTPHNSWVVYSTGEQNQLMHPQSRLRSRYIKTKDPLPVMNYKQLVKALPANYNLPLGQELTASTEGLPELLKEETLSVEESLQLEEKSEDRVSLSSSTGFVGDEIYVEADRGLLKVTAVYLNGIQADFLVDSDKSLLFAIPQGSTSGMVKLLTSSGKKINAGVLEVVGG